MCTFVSPSITLIMICVTARSGRYSRKDRSACSARFYYGQFTNTLQIMHIVLQKLYNSYIATQNTRLLFLFDEVKFISGAICTMYCVGYRPMPMYRNVV